MHAQVYHCVDHEGVLVQPAQEKAQPTNRWERCWQVGLQVYSVYVGGWSPC
jgi:hypothetical protein